MGGSCCQCIQTSIDCLCFTFDERDEQKNKPNGTYRQAVRLGSGIGVGDWGSRMGSVTCAPCMVKRMHRNMDQIAANVAEGYPPITFCFAATAIDTIH